MIRSILMTGMIFGFIASAFVAPTDANFQSVSAMAKSQVKVRTTAALLGGVADPMAMRNAALALEKVAADPAAAAAFKNAGSALDPGKMESVVYILREVTPEAKVVTKRITAAMRAAQTLRKTSALWKKTKYESQNKDLVERLEDIEWATRKKDVRLCRDVMNGIPADSLSTPGDFLALCLAKVTRDPARCSQIHEGLAPALRKLCTEELAT